MEPIRKRAVRILIDRHKRWYNDLEVKWAFIMFCTIIPPFALILIGSFIYQLIEVKRRGMVRGEFSNIDYDDMAATELSHGIPHVKSNLYHRRCNKKCKKY